MKKIYIYALTALAAVVAQPALSQDNVGIGTKSPDNSAVLDIQSAEKGLLIPRMTVDQRNAINNPAEGLLIFQTNGDQGFQFFNGTQWSPLSPTEAKSVATGDVNGWALDGNAAASGTKAAATAASFLGTPAAVPINFKIGGVKAGSIFPNTNLNMGYNSGSAGASGANNTGFGSNSIKSLTTGANNAALGAYSLENNTTGGNNMGVGAYSLRANTTGSHNTGLGTYSLVVNTNGTANVGIGSQALSANTTGSGNLGLGTYALNGNVSGNFNTAIGTQAGINQKGSSNIFLGYNAGNLATATTESNKLYIANSNTTTPLIYGDFSAKYVSIGDVDPAKRASANTSGGYNLLVKGGILTEKVKVALASSADWADYVFEPSYNLLSLEEVEKFTLENKHLPNVPSADEMALNGLDVNETSKMFMEKIEELTLYLIDLNKEVKQLKSENALLQAKIK